MLPRASIIGSIGRSYRACFSSSRFLLASVISIGILVLGVTLDVYANVYATERASNPVTDIVLSNVPVFDVDGLFVYGTFAFVVFVLFVWLLRPQWLPFSAASLGLFFLIRTCFVSLTHVGPFPDHVVLDVGTLMAKVIGGNDLFFSGHTGAPFLLALVFWQTPLLRWVFLGTSIAFATIVLLGHLHYSIDVAAAYFITYTIFCIAGHLFERYREFFYDTQKL